MHSKIHELLNKLVNVSPDLKLSLQIQICITRSIAAAEGGALWTGGYVPLDERKSWERIRGGPFLPPPDLLTGTEHGLVKCCDFKTTCNGSRQLSIEHSSPDQLDTAALDSANCY
jgi:hypothetical protein